jgi:hypothetical protein
MIVSIGGRKVPAHPLMDEPDFFLMSNLKPAHTGLPLVVWISLRPDDRPDVRIWVSKSAKASPSQFVTVAISPDVQVMEGQMPSTDLALLRRWVELNRNVIEAHWRGEIESSEEAIKAIRHVTAARA